MSKTINIATTTGMNDVPVFYHNKVKGLCVTMCQFGTFEVTHVDSGRKLLGGYERAASAVSVMLRIYIAMIEIDVNPQVEMESLQKSIRDNSGFKHEVLSSMSIIDSIKLHNQFHPISGEFPWESFEESPFGEIEELEKKLV